MTDRLLNAMRLRRLCWDADDRGDMDALRRLVRLADDAARDLNHEELHAYWDFLESDPITAAILERARTGAKLQ